MRLIDGDALIEKFNEKVDMAECLIDARTAERFATFCALADAVEEMPTADVAPVRRGRWRWVAYDANPKIGNWHCTYCNRIPKSFQKEDFCPNCGAKMDKEAE